MNSYLRVSIVQSASVSRLPEIRKMERIREQYCLHLAVVVHNKADFHLAVALLRGLLQVTYNKFSLLIALCILPRKALDCRLHDVAINFHPELEAR